MVRHGDLTGSIQKLSAFYIIYDLFKTDGQTESPFVPFFLNLLEPKDLATPKLNLIERNFLTQLLNAGTKEFIKQTPSHVIHSELTPHTQEVTSAKHAHNEKLKELPMTVKSGLMNVVPAPT